MTVWDNASRAPGALSGSGAKPYKNLRCARARDNPSTARRNEAESSSRGVRKPDINSLSCPSHSPAKASVDCFPRSFTFCRSFLQTNRLSMLRAQCGSDASDVLMPCSLEAYTVVRQAWRDLGMESALEAVCSLGGPSGRQNFGPKTARAKGL